MNKHKRETIMIGVGLIVLSLFLHYLHYLTFRDLHHTLIFLFANYIESGVFEFLETPTSTSSAFSKPSVSFPLSYFTANSIAATLLK